MSRKREVVVIGGGLNRGRPTIAPPVAPVTPAPEPERVIEPTIEPVNKPPANEKKAKKNRGIK